MKTIRWNGEVLGVLYDSGNAEIIADLDEIDVDEFLDEAPTYDIPKPITEKLEDYISSEEDTMDNLQEGFVEETEERLIEKLESSVKSSRNEWDSPYWLYRAFCLIMEEEYDWTPLREFQNLTGKEKGQWKHLYNMYGVENGIEMIECFVLDYQALENAFNLDGRPSIGILLGFKDQVEAAVSSGEGFTTRSHRVSKFAKRKNNKEE